MTPFVPCDPIPESEIQRLIRDYKAAGVPYNEANIRFEQSMERWINDTYTVAVRGRGTGIVHLSIKRNDREAVHDWRDLQTIKNQFVGPECEGVEIYPAESRLVDAANQYHLWVWEDPNFRLPLGFNERLVRDETVGSNAKQRPRT